MKLGDRMKGYEEPTKQTLTRRTPTIIRVDGKAFHTWTKQAKCERPFDSKLHYAMLRTTCSLMDEVQNAAVAYTQSDEISVLLTDWTNLDTEQWFAGSVQKIASVSASIATAVFNMWMESYSRLNPALFDARVFQLPKEEVANYFIWRQKDALRNSVSMLGRAHFSHRELQGKSTEDIKMMLHQKRISWADCEQWQLMGSVVTKNTTGGLDEIDTPIFTENRDYIEDWL